VNRRKQCGENRRDNPTNSRENQEGALGKMDVSADNQSQGSAGIFPKVGSDACP
jgi:hypothetical protein